MNILGRISSLAVLASVLACPWSLASAAGPGTGWHHAGPFQYYEGIIPYDRNRWAEAGVNLHLSVLTNYQNIVSGGLESYDELSGSYDLQLYLDTKRIGWWENGNFMFRMEGKTDDKGVNDFTGALIPVNLDPIIPQYGGTAFVLTEWYYTHMFADDKVELLIGTWDVARFLDLVPHSGPYPYRNMNVNMYWNNVLLDAAPYHALGGLLMISPRPGLTITTGIADPRSESVDVNWYKGGDFTLYHEWRFLSRPGGKPLLWAFGGIYKDQEQLTLAQPPGSSASSLSNQNRYWGTALEPQVSVNEPGVATQSSDWAAYANFTLWLKGSLLEWPNIGWFGRIGVTDGDINPVKTHVSTGFGFDGIWESRPRDSLGIVAWYDEFSDDLGTPDDSSYGMEIHYRIQATPWLQISPDVQYLIKSGPDSSTDDTVVVGLRAMFNF